MPVQGKTKRLVGGYTGRWQTRGYNGPDGGGGTSLLNLGEDQRHRVKSARTTPANWQTTTANERAGTTGDGGCSTNSIPHSCRNGPAKEIVRIVGKGKEKLGKKRHTRKPTGPTGEEEEGGGSTQKKKTVVQRGSVQKTLTAGGKIARGQHRETTVEKLFPGTTGGRQVGEPTVKIAAGQKKTKPLERDATDQKPRTVPGRRKT